MPKLDGWSVVPQIGAGYPKRRLRLPSAASPAPGCDQTGHRQLDRRRLRRTANLQQRFTLLGKTLCLARAKSGTTGQARRGRKPAPSCSRKRGHVPVELNRRPVASHLDQGQAAVSSTSCASSRICAMVIPVTLYCNRCCHKRPRRRRGAARDRDSWTSRWTSSNRTRPASLSNVFRYKNDSEKTGAHLDRLRRVLPPALSRRLGMDICRPRAMRSALNAGSWAWPQSCALMDQLASTTTTTCPRRRRGGTKQKGKKAGPPEGRAARGDDLPTERTAFGPQALTMFASNP